MRITPCRLSFVLCAVIAFLIDAELASHITVADPPEVQTFAATFQRELPV